MMFGMETTKAKVTITLRSDVLRAVRTRVEHGDARSVSAFIEHAVSAQLAVDADFDGLIDEMLAATGGPPSAEETASARRLLSGSAA